MNVWIETPYFSPSPCIIDYNFFITFKSKSKSLNFIFFFQNKYVCWVSNDLYHNSRITYEIIKVYLETKSLMVKYINTCQISILHKDNCVYNREPICQSISTFSKRNATNVLIKRWRLRPHNAYRYLKVHWFLKGCLLVVGTGWLLNEWTLHVDLSLDCCCFFFFLICR